MGYINIFVPPIVVENVVEKDEVIPNAQSVPTGLNVIKAVDFWTLDPSKGQNVKVAIFDTGCDTAHPDLAANIKGVRNFTTEDSGNVGMVTDYNGHGTHVAGTVGAIDNADGVVGVAPNVSLYIYKVLGVNGGTTSWIKNAMIYAINQDIDIINMSLGGGGYDFAFDSLIESATRQNIMVVCAAGNSGDANSLTDEWSYPAAYNSSISVGSVTATRSISSFSNSNNQVDVMAPGSSVYSTYKNSSYATLSGTSMASPHVAGALALIKNWAAAKFGRQMSEVELYAQLLKKTLDLGDNVRIQGNGMVYLTSDQELRQYIEAQQQQQNK